MRERIYKIKKAAIAIALTFLAGIAGLTIWRYVSDDPEATKVRKELGEPVVNVVLPERGHIIDDRRFSGTLLPWSSFDIDPEVSGRLLSLYFDIGDTIRRGELIAKIDDVPYVQAVKEAEAGLEVARAKYREAVDLTNFYLSEFRRVEKLQANQAISYSDYEKAESNLKVQEAKKAQYEAEIRSCEAKLISAQRDLANTTIKADWPSGAELRHVGERYVDTGALLSTGKPILKIISIDKIKARIQIIERDFRFFRLGQEAEIMPDAFPGEVFHGVISMMSNELSETTRTLVAQITIPNEDYRLLPGMFIRVRIILSEHKNAQLLPPSALLTVNDRQGVYTYDPKTNIVRFVPVKIGIALRDKVEIVEPELQLPVVTVGNHLLKDGATAIVSALSKEEMAKRLADLRESSQKAKELAQAEEAQANDGVSPAADPSAVAEARKEAASAEAFRQELSESVTVRQSDDAHETAGNFAPLRNGEKGLASDALAKKPMDEAASHEEKNDATEKDVRAKESGQDDAPEASMDESTNSKGVAL